MNEQHNADYHAAALPPTQTQSVPQNELFHQRRAMSRRMASALVAAMAELDTSFEILAVRLNRQSGELRACMYRLIDGNPKSQDMESAIDMATALGTMIMPSVARPRPAQGVRVSG